MSKLPSLGPSLTHHLVENRRQMQRRADSSSFNRSGMSASAEGETTVDGTLNVTGNLDVSGHAAITGTLSLPAGIIDNAALNSPVVPGIVNLTNTGFAVTLTWADAAATTITVPPGCTQLLATCHAGTYATNPNTTGGSGGGGDLLCCRVSLNGSVSIAGDWGLSGNGGMTSASSSGSFQFDSLTPGSALPISAQVCSAYQSLGSNATNRANINATLIWLR